MGGIYWVISQILLFWHGIWDKVLPSGAVLGTNWQWILAIVFLVVTVRIVLFPIFVKQIKSQRAMQALQPRMKELQTKHKGDKETMQKELMELYKAEKVNPLMGCLPMVLQIPVFFGLFHVLKHLQPGMSDKNKQLYGWDIERFKSAADARLFDAPIPAKFSSSSGELSDLGADATTVMIVAAVLVIVMMITTFLNSRQMILKTGWSTDPQQLMIQRLMLYGIPLSLLISGWAFPIGVIIYWVVNNLVSLGQQSWVLHKYPPPPSAVTATPAKPGGRTGSTATDTGKGGFFAWLNGTRPAAPKATPNGARPTGTKATGAKADGAKPNGRAAATGAPDGTGAIDGKALGPKPGAKPVNPKPGTKPGNPKKGGPAKR
ncbi:MAG TPA: membrane protein insertase YidC [Micromonosporaceae bacterium]|nr:membrane protein insertase YidC [Micromonosporaceae bacterium]